MANRAQILVLDATVQQPQSAPGLYPQELLSHRLPGTGPPRGGHHQHSPQPDGGSNSLESIPRLFRGDLTTTILIRPELYGRTPHPGRPCEPRRFECAVRVCRCATHSTLAAHSRCQRSVCVDCKRLAATI